MAGNSNSGKRASFEGSVSLLPDRSRFAWRKPITEKRQHEKWGPVEIESYLRNHVFRVESSIGHVLISQLAHNEASIVELKRELFREPDMTVKDRMRYRAEIRKIESDTRSLLGRAKVLQNALIHEKVAPGGTGEKIDEEDLVPPTDVNELDLFPPVMGEA